MARHSDRKILRPGAITPVGLLVVMAASFNLQKFPGFRGTTYHAEFIDASGLHVGSEVRVAGIRVGRVQDIRIQQDKVVVDFEVKDATPG
ncbi:MlaD family protein [Nocardioides sp. B-3]|uniref:MlaD family protein n=1 Tax=Nocardioides sp. B-3 TaxID=2895565 RepID=UPI00215365A4|nr:MlaD family protein [Nocardioides sp. B-3]UUZ59334.1 MlaD family protein [Nocardioides sp. B-3]